MSQPAIALFTDFGVTDPYVGQMHAAIHARAPGAAIIDLHHYAPAFSPAKAGLLLDALAPFLDRGTVVVGVVDPGVGTERGTLAVSVAGLWLVGPDNGLFAPFIEAEEGASCYRLEAPNEVVSTTFHGRDLFAPAGAELLRGDRLVLGDRVPDPVRTSTERAQVIYVDHYGNLFTGLPVPDEPERHRLRIADRELPFARTFGEVALGGSFWYRNSLDRVEVAAREDSASRILGVGLGSPVAWGES